MSAEDSYDKYYHEEDKYDHEEVDHYDPYQEQDYG